MGFAAAYGTFVGYVIVQGLALVLNSRFPRQKGAPLELWRKAVLAVQVTSFIVMLVSFVAFFFTQH